MSIEARHISKTFGTTQVLGDVSVTVPDGELVALLGPSGSGKTTLLRVIAGLERPDPGSGSVLFDDADVASRPVGSRGVGFVFQHYALFRNLTVFENIAFGLRVRPRRRRPSRAAIREKVHELLALIQLEGLAERYPSQLSGGQRQRVALARVLAVEPRILLLDEPFGALDAQVRQDLRRWLRRLHDEIRLTSVFVTHDQEEALEVADRVVVMNQGRIEQVGTPEEVFHRPATEFVMRFIGQVNLFHGRVEDGKAVIGEGGKARVFVRPGDFEVAVTSPGFVAPKQGLTAVVRHVNAAGTRVRLDLVSSAGEPVLAEISRERFLELGLVAGSAVLLTPREIKVFTDDYSI